MEQTDFTGLLEKITELGAARAALTDVSSITFRLLFREICTANSCGMFGKCWMCPPDVGDAAGLIDQAKSYRYAVVYQTVSPLEDSFDIEGMLEAGQRQNQLAQSIQRQLRCTMDEEFLHLGAGGCRRCSLCARAENAPCRFPGESMSSLEAYCIDVTELAKSCGLPYNNGPDTVTYFGAVLLR